MTDPADIPPDEPDMTAAELALGVLDGEAYRAAAARLASDGAFAAEVAAWEARLAPLAAEVASVRPPDGVWPRIAADIAPPRRAGLWDSIGFWRGATVAGMAVAAGLLVMVISTGRPPPPPTGRALQPIEVATLAPEAGKPATVVATLDPNSRELVLTSVSLALAPDKSPELWVIPKGEAPISLGVMDLSKPYRIPMPAELEGAGRTTATLAITAEQLGGSPDKKPHGPVVTAGTFT